MKIHEWTRRQSFPFLLVVHVCGIFPWQTIFTSAIFNLSTRQQDLQICCHEKLGRWVKNFFFVAEQFYFIVTATFFISNELPFLRISQNLHFHKISNFNFTKTIIYSDLVLFTNSIFSFEIGQHYLAQNQMDYPERSVWSGFCWLSCRIVKRTTKWSLIERSFLRIEPEICENAAKRIANRAQIIS